MVVNQATYQIRLPLVYKCLPAELCPPVTLYIFHVFVLSVFRK